MYVFICVSACVVIEDISLGVIILIKTQYQAYEISVWFDSWGNSNDPKTIQTIAVSIACHPQIPIAEDNMHFENRTWREWARSYLKLPRWGLAFRGEEGVIQDFGRGKELIVLPSFDVYESQG